jgi:hypothetical protein
MTKSEKRTFVKNVCSDILNDVIYKINHDKIPENWDGFELRELLADKFRESAYLLHNPANKKGSKIIRMM